MAKSQSPLLGYNNNVRHKNRVFHVQTEDSGVKRPHIITHLFMDGGRILKSVRKSYAEHVGADGMSDIVREMMKNQHKAMITALREGEFDRLLNAGPDTKALAGSRATAASCPAAPPPPPKVARDSTPPPTLRASGHANDVALNDDAARAASAPHSLLRDSIPPPPQPRKSDTRTNAGRYALAQGDVPAQSYRAPLPSKRAARDRMGRYTQAQPASVFREASRSSIFGDDVVNDKSLDEVILSYLADDLKPPRRK